MYPFHKMPKYTVYTVFISMYSELALCWGDWGSVIEQNRSNLVCLHGVFHSGKGRMYYELN